MIFFFSSCATVPYVPFPAPESPQEFSECPANQIARGEPNVFFDSIGHYFFSLPSKLILWNWRVENHDISCDTERALRTYLDENHLESVKVRLNQYDPGDEWHRLFNNPQVGAGWRYTIGVISVLFYTILPGRIFGGDHYNPWTDSINLYSDLPVIALHEAGHAKDFAKKEYKGSYAALDLLPLVSLMFEGRASGDAIGYMKENDLCPLEKSAYKVLYPAYGTYVGGEAVNLVSIFTPISALYSLAFVIPGHIIGRYKASQLECKEPAAATEPANAPVAQNRD